MLSSRHWFAPLTALALLALAGCLDERSFRVAPREVIRTAPAAAPLPTRAWLERTHTRLRNLLPDRGRDARLTNQLVQPDGAPVDVFATYRRDFDRLHTLVHNLKGLEDSAQATCNRNAYDAPPPPWPGFTDVWVNVGDVDLNCRIGWATDSAGNPVSSNCVVLLPGLLGDNAVWRTRDIAAALVAHGIHACAVELRGCGQTEARFPAEPYTFGILDSTDLQRLAAWLEAQPHVRATGMIGFCWGANQALVTLWDSQRRADHPSVTPRLAARLHERPAGPHFRAGVLAFSPVLRFEEVVDACQTPHGTLGNPVLAALQASIDRRAAYKHRGDLHGSLLGLIQAEFAATEELSYPTAVPDCLRFLRLLDHGDQPAFNKLCDVNAPVLIVHAANDPLATAQAVADLAAQCDNPNVATLLLPGGGHIGFAPYARVWFYNLILNFFDPATAPAQDTRHSEPARSDPARAESFAQARGPQEARR